MRLRKWLLLVFALSLVVAACGDDEGETTTTTAAETTTTTEAGGLELIEPGVLTIGSDVPYPPFEDFDADGNVIGFDADLMNEIAAASAWSPAGSTPTSTRSSPSWPRATSTWWPRR